MIDRYRKFLNELYPQNKFNIIISTEPSEEFKYYNTSKTIIGTIDKEVYRRWERNNNI